MNLEVVVFVAYHRAWVDDRPLEEEGHVVMDHQGMVFEHLPPFWVVVAYVSHLRNQHDGGWLEDSLDLQEDNKK